jgi:hypothetical protein
MATNRSCNAGVELADLSYVSFRVLFALTPPKRGLR